ncbi:aminotransferase class I/II-fold pyridoxal phosphate-dependent enzyme [Nocardia rosealba]|uniref:aminotransferase class I/II-fold pyridoxal phosphate-dependent enzyme n=1 Tax=Nocardia rosealba TaxID=2878563 RepID=UPI001CD9EB7D|nr:aminotransferase class I/II-fold pyridoxal phosphate-dependent enzyme [Nocardia rosealba]MCA2205588.1 aminotransferase class I/II-fold pyridoxal phosphate-dependent enzyme [Nocardia rosealba]
MTDPGSAVLVRALAADASHTSESVRAVTARLIRDGSLAEGIRLPTIRELAQHCGLSTRTVVAAWGELRKEGLIATNRRGGTVVAAAGGVPLGRPLAERDLLTGSPDYALQPDLAPAMLAGLHTDDLNRPGRDYITDRLRAAVCDGWPFPAEAFVAAGGGSEGLFLAVNAAAPDGALVAVEEPVMPGFLDTLTEVGYRVIGIAADEQGALPDSLAEALRRSPAVVVLQPEGAYATGGVLSPHRAAELAEVFAAAEAEPWIVEDDAVGPLAAAQAHSLGSWYPERCVRVRSYCKAFGMDIRTCVIGGSAELVDRAIRARVHGIAANSRILQNALAHLITDPGAAALIDTARERYAARRAGLIAALAAHGVVAEAGTNSLVVWVEVADEQGALLRCARHGVVVGSAARSHVAAARAAIRVAVPQLPDDPRRLAELAALLADAAASTHREFLD